MGKFYKIYSEKLTFGLALTMNKRLMPLMYAEAGFGMKLFLEAEYCMWSLCLKLASPR